jgi:hypothetical protein
VICPENVAAIYDALLELSGSECGDISCAMMFLIRSR